MKLSEKILSLRTARGLSQGDLAEKLEVSRQSVSKWETGQSVPDLDKIVRLAEFFGVTTDYLLRENDAPPLPPEPQFVYVERPQEEQPVSKKELGTREIVCILLFLTGALTIFAFLGAGMLWHADETALLLIFALLGFSAELFFSRRHPCATLLWTVVGLLPFWIHLTVGGIDRSTRYFMIVIGLTAAAFGLFLTYHRKS